VLDRPDEAIRDEHGLGHFIPNACGCGFLTNSAERISSRQ
jgi:hypothetical protein